MQPPPAPSMPTDAPPAQRSRLPAILAVGAVVLLVVGGIVGYLIGSSAVGRATLRADVENRLTMNLTVQVTVNGRNAATLTILAGQTVSLDVPVSFATANPALFEVEAVSTLGPRDSNSVLVNAPGTYVVSLPLG